ncbi:MAG: hypothetical protein O3B01_04700 [Planctomycetota bacterium]|nr:hypothetical protein [Planctomycetota bacterium]MDA1137861.1 hypothetical protein [Planctomycetota bacterium]
MDILTLHDWLFSPNSALLVAGIAAVAMAAGGAYLTLLKKRPESTVLKRRNSPLQRRLNRIENWSLSLRASYRLVLAFMSCAAAVWLVLSADKELTVHQAAWSFSLELIAILLAAGSLLWGRNERKAFESIGAHRNAARPPGIAIYGQVCALRSFEGRGEPPALYPLLYQSTVSRLANLSLEQELPWRWSMQLRYAANVSILLIFLSFMVGSLSEFVQDTAELLNQNAMVNERLPMERPGEEQRAKKEDQPPSFPPEGDEQQEGDSGQQSKGGSESGLDAPRQEKQSGEKDQEQESDSNQKSDQSSGEASKNEEGKSEQTQEQQEGGDRQGQPQKNLGKERTTQSLEEDPNRPPDVPPEELNDKKTPQQSSQKKKEQDPNRPPDVPPEDLKEQQQASESLEQQNQEQGRKQEKTGARDQSQDEGAPSQRPDETTEDSTETPQSQPRSAEREPDKPSGSGTKECPAPQNGRTADQQNPTGNRNQKPGKGDDASPQPGDPNKAPDVPPEQLSEEQSPSPSQDGEQEVGTQDSESQQPKIEQKRAEEAKRLAQPNDDGQENQSKEYGNEPGPDPLGNGNGNSKKMADLKDTEFKDMRLKRGEFSSPDGKPEDVKPPETEPQRATSEHRYNPRTELKANRYVEPLPISPQRVPPEYRTAFRKLFQRDE